MTAAALTALAIAAGGILSPAQVLLTLLLLSAPRGLGKALTYFTGHCGAYVTMGITSVLVSANLRDQDI